MDDMFEKLDEESRTYNIHIFEDDKQEFRRVSEKVRAGLENAGFNQESIFKYLKKQIDLPRIKHDLILTK